MSKKSKKRKKKPIRIAQTGRFSYLSSHAIERLQERTQMTPDEMNHLLDHHGYFKLGSHAGFHRIHLLFYSQKDDNFFVAIQDERMGKVVTILPTTYHDTLAWRISAEDCEQAKQKFDDYYQACQLSVQQKVEKTPTKPQVTPQKPQKLARFVYRFCHDNDEYTRLEFVTQEVSLKRPKFVLTILYVDKHLRVKRKKLFKIQSEAYDNDVKKLWQDHEILAKIDETVHRKNVQQQSIFLLEVLNRQKNLLEYIQFREQEEAYRFMQSYVAKLQIMYDFLQTLDLNQNNRIFLPKWQIVPLLDYQPISQPTKHKKTPSKKQLAWAIFVMILLTLIYQLFKQKIKRFFSLK